jgi:hypothetical protein
VVQLLHLGAFWFRLRSNVLLDLFLHRHIGLLGSAINQCSRKHRIEIGLVGSVNRRK